ncbi:MAG: NAD(P)H-dependent oxidoreductase [Myxococcota bacterium]
MKNAQTIRLLRVDASPRRKGSQSRRWADRVESELRQSVGPLEVMNRDLADGVPLLSEDALAGIFKAGEDQSEAERRALAPSVELVQELQTADAVLLALPIHNFHVPAAFKAWIDLVVRSRLTFRFGPDGPEGLVANKPVFIVVTSGGTQLHGPLDFITSWLTHVLSFIGLRDLRWVEADAMSKKGEGAERALEQRVQALTQAGAA